MSERCMACDVTMTTEEGVLNKAMQLMVCKACYDRNVRTELTAWEALPDTIPSHIADHIYVGGQTSSRKLSTFRELQITHVLICALHCKPVFVDDPDAKITYHSLPLDDDPSQDIGTFLPEALAFIQSAKKAKGNILIHCVSGISRSGAVAIAYLMQTRLIDYETALKLARAQRPMIHPNSGFQRQVKGWAAQHILTTTEERKVKVVPPVKSMISSLLLQNVNLKKITTTEKESSTTMETLKTAVELERVQNERLRAVDMEAWYDSIPELTFKSHFVPLSIAEAQAIKAQYERTKINAPQEENKKNTALLDGLKTRIAEGMKQLGSDSVFVKLSSRSPKDSHMCQARSVALAKASLEKYYIEHNNLIPDSNAVMIALMSAAVHCLKLTSPDDIIACLATSERICEDDIPLALNFPKKWTQHIVLRSWQDLEIDQEMRVFVYNGKLTAACQYYNEAYFPELVSNQTQIVSLLEQLVKSCLERLPEGLTEFSMDVVVDLKQQSCYVVELNPFGKPDGLGTGTVLFHVENEHDYKVLFGEAPFEFRVETEKVYRDMNVELTDGPLKQWLKQKQWL